MGCYKIGTECCNNCYHWECHADRRLRGNPPSEVYTDSNLGKCDISGKTTRSDEVCGMFRHLGDVTRTFALDKKPERDIGGEFAASLAEFTRDMNSIRTASAIASAAVEEKFDYEEFSRKVDAQTKIQEERNRAIERSSELLRAGIDPIVFAKNDLDRAVEFMHLYDAASGGDAEAQYELYKALWNGDRGAKKVRLRANVWLDEAANGGCVDAQVKTAEKRFECESVGAWEQGLEWYEKADRGGDRNIRIARCESLIKVAKCYLAGKNYAPVDFSKGVNMLKQAIALGATDIEGLLVQCQKEVDVVKPTVDHIVAEAQNGDADAQDKLGMIYAQYSRYKKYGCCIPCDYEKAFEWFSKAANQGLAAAMRHLGLCYERGEGVSKDEQKAAHWMGLSACAGNESAMHGYGWKLIRGTGVEKNVMAGVSWVIRSALKGNNEAAKRMADIARNDYSVIEKDPMVAFEFCSMAAKGGDANYMMRLCYMYENGDGCEKDEAKAAEWRQKAKDAGWGSGW